MIISGNSEQNHKIAVTIADFWVQKGLNNRLSISLKMCALATTLFHSVLLHCSNVANGSSRSTHIKSMMIPSNWLH